MKILLHCVYFPPEVGGLESHVYYLARALVAQGHQVGVVTSRSLPNAPVREEMDGVQVHRTWFPDRSPWGWMAHAMGSVPRTVALARDADIVHAQAFASIPPCDLARKMWGKPLVATLHTSHFLTRAKKPRWKTLLGSLVRRPDHVLASSDEIARVAMALAPGVSVEPLANGVETEFFRRVEPALPPASRIRILVPRRLFQKNGVEYFVRALPAILENVDAEAILIGDGPERGRLEELAGTLGVLDRISFLGRRPHAEMPGLLSSGDLAVIPSLMEATSVAALEAMACQLPVWASNVGGLPELVDPEVGGLFPPGDPEALARAVIQGIQEGNLADKGRVARERVVSRWSNERLARRHVDIYSDLLQSRG